MRPFPVPIGLALVSLALVVPAHAQAPDPPGTVTSTPAAPGDTATRGDIDALTKKLTGLFGPIADQLDDHDKRIHDLGSRVTRLERSGGLERRSTARPTSTPERRPAAYPEPEDRPQARSRPVPTTQVIRRTVGPTRVVASSRAPFVLDRAGFADAGSSADAANGSASSYATAEPFASGQAPPPVMYSAPSSSCYSSGQAAGSVYSVPSYSPGPLMSYGGGSSSFGSSFSYGGGGGGPIASYGVPAAAPVRSVVLLPQSSYGSPAASYGGLGASYRLPGPASSLQATSLRRGFLGGIRASSVGSTIGGGLPFSAGGATVCGPGGCSVSSGGW